MSRMWIRCNFVIPLVMLFVSSMSIAGADYSPRVGQPHADFVLPRIDNGQPVRLSQFRGRRVLLVHFASW